MNTSIIPLSIGVYAYKPIPVYDLAMRVLNRELNTLQYELESINAGCVQEVIATENPLIQFHYNRNPLAGPDPNHSVPFTLQVEDHTIAFTTSLTHPFVKDFHAHTLASDNDVYKNFAYDVNPPAHQFTLKTRVDFTQPFTNVPAKIRCSYVINGTDKTMRFHAQDGHELAHFLGLFLSLYGFSDAVHDSILALPLWRQ
jgi:hypothetical protein